MVIFQACCAKAANIFCWAKVKAPSVSAEFWMNDLLFIVYSFNFINYRLPTPFKNYSN
jgi:hypothetical protein